MNRLIAIIFFLYSSSYAQLDDNILFKVNDSIVYVDEFNRVYSKNFELIDENNQKDFESYLELFINYKLKLAEAYEMGLHNDPKYKSELNKYVKQLQNTYLTDKGNRGRPTKRGIRKNKI